MIEIPGSKEQAPEKKAPEDPSVPNTVCPLRMSSAPMMAAPQFAGGPPSPVMLRQESNCRRDCMWFMRSNRDGQEGACAVSVLAQAMRRAK